MLPLRLILLALPFTALGAPLPSAAPAALKPIFGSWGECCKPFKPGKLGDKWNPPTPPPPPPVYQAPPPPSPPSPPSPPAPPPPQAEPEYGQAGQRQAKESAARSDVTRMAASNSVALFNGIPVDPVTGRPIVDGEDEPQQLEKRGLLRKKLGLQFLDDPDADENVIREAMNSQLIGTGLAAGAFDELSEAPTAPAETASQEESPAEEPATAPPAPAPAAPSKPKVQPWNSNSYMIVNGVPVVVEGDVTSRALDVSKFNDATTTTTSTLQKRGDVRRKLGLGMFDMPSVSGRRKGMSLEPVLDAEAEVPAEEAEEAEAESAVQQGEEGEEEEGEGEEQQLLSHPSESLDDARDTGIQELPRGKSFVIYNGRTVEVDGAPFSGAKIKKPRPAFRHSGGNRPLTKRDAGRKYTGLNPFRPNPITGGIGHQDARLAATSNDNGATNQERQQHKVEELSPHTSEQESVNVNVGDSYALFNGKPVALAGKKAGTAAAKPETKGQLPKSLASSGMSFFEGM